MADKSAFIATMFIALISVLNKPIAQTLATGTREVPARSLPVPDTVSPQMHAIIAKPLDPSFNIAPTTREEWKARVETASRPILAALPKLREALGVGVQAIVIAGVKAFIVTPKAIPENHKDVVLLHFHGGIRVFNPGEAGTQEAILMAGFGGYRSSRLTIECRPISHYRQPWMMRSQSIANCSKRQTLRT